MTRLSRMTEAERRYDGPIPQEVKDWVAFGDPYSAKMARSNAERVLYLDLCRQAKAAIRGIDKAMSEGWATSDMPTRRKVKLGYLRSLVNHVCALRRWHDENEKLRAEHSKARHTKAIHDLVTGKNAA